MSNVKRKICSIILLVMLVTVVLSTLSACHISDLVGGIFVHKDGVYYTVHVFRRYVAVHGFDKKDGTQVYEIPSKIKYGAIRYPVKEFFPSSEINHRLVVDGEITELIVPATVEELLLMGFSGKGSFQKVTVDEKNANYVSVDGIVYSKDKSQLIYYPPANADSILVLPRETTVLHDTLSGKNNLSAIYVEEGNTSFSAQDGVLFSADGKKLVCYPLNKRDETYTIPMAWSVLNTYWFERNQYLKHLEVQEGNTVFSAYNGDLYSADGSILLYRPNNDSIAVLELPETITTIGLNMLNGVEFLYVPSGLERVIFYSYGYYDENYNNPIANVRYIYFEDDQLPFCLRYTNFTGSVTFGVTREEFQLDVASRMNRGD